MVHGGVSSVAAAAIIAWMTIAPEAVSAAEPAVFRCDFEKGHVFVFDKGLFRSENVKAMAFGFKGIDRARQTAVMEQAGGEVPVKVVLAVNALHFLEVAAEGFLNVTTIYDRDEVSGSHPAVHSRHFGVLGQAVVSQYQGRCSPG
ncbi:MAG TPA: hypothetical protein PK970_10530 [Hyphomicrobiaceae bacterium]|nr:hypothetical protein [Hyphomicrobiaceae bacterium]